MQSSWTVPAGRCARTANILGVRGWAGAAGFAAVTVGLAVGPLGTVDLAIRNLADAHRPYPAEVVAQLVNRLGSGGLLTILALACAVGVVWLRRSWWPLAPVAATLVLTSVVIGGLKLVCDRAAPHSPLPDQVEVSLLGQSGGLSYPSGHAVNAVVWYGVGLLLLRITVPRWVRLVPPLAVTVAGTYLGYHWLTDMLAGLCLGVALDHILSRVPAGVPARRRGR